ncbi:MAG: hypothetical protein AAB912_02525 [Patescibacteria group bacterium]
MNRSTPQYRSTNNGTPATQNAASRTHGNRQARKERKFCTHGVPKAQCPKKHGGDDEGTGSPTAQ